MDEDRKRMQDRRMAGEGQDEGTAVAFGDPETMDQLTAHIYRGWEGLSRGDYEAARTSALSALDVDSDSPDAHTLWGAVVWSAGATDQALDAFEQAMELEPVKAEPFIYAAEILSQDAERLSEALSLCDDAIEMLDVEQEPALLAEAWLVRAEILTEMGKEDAARDIMSRQVSLMDARESLYERLGALYIRLGDDDHAEQYLKMALEQDSTPDAHYFLGHIAFRRGHQRRSILHFLDCRERDLNAPSPPWAYSPDAFELAVLDAVSQASGKLDRDCSQIMVRCVQYPGIELVLDGVDPRIPVLAGGREEAQYMVVYQKNIEKMCRQPEDLHEVLVQVIEEELRASAVDDVSQ